MKKTLLSTLVLSLLLFSTLKPMDWNYLKVQAGKVINVLALAHGCHSLMRAVTDILSGNAPDNVIAQRVCFAALAFLTHSALQTGSSNISDSAKILSIGAGALTPFLGINKCPVLPCPVSAYAH